MGIGTHFLGQSQAVEGLPVGYLLVFQDCQTLSKDKLYPTVGNPEFPIRLLCPIFLLSTYCRYRISFVVIHHCQEKLNVCMSTLSEGQMLLDVKRPMMSGCGDWMLELDMYVQFNLLWERSPPPGIRLCRERDFTHKFLLGRPSHSPAGRLSPQWISSSDLLLNNLLLVCVHLNLSLLSLEVPNRFPDHTIIHVLETLFLGHNPLRVCTNQHHHNSLTHSQINSYTLSSGPSTYQIYYFQEINDLLSKTISYL